MRGVEALALTVGKVGDHNLLENGSAEMGGKKESDAVEVADVDAACLRTLVDEHDEEKDVGCVNRLGMIG